MKGCELCERPAWMYCESDQATLCWDCDARVHGANFLVARHSRSLLCRRCQAPTPWKAEGARVGPAVSFCERCAARSSGGKTMMEGAGDADNDEREEEDCDEINEEEEEDEVDNQVVPWKLAPPPATGSSRSDESSSSHRKCNGFSKRSRENADIDCSQDNQTCTSLQLVYLVAAPSTQFTAQATAEDETTSFYGPFRPFKACRRSGDHARSTTGPSASLHFHNQLDQWAIDSVSSAHTALESE